MGATIAGIGGGLLISVFGGILLFDSEGLSGTRAGAQGVTAFSNVPFTIRSGNVIYSGK